MINLPLTQCAALFGIELPDQGVVFNGISINSRTTQPGNLFVALIGENHDSHLFLDEAHKNGAVAALVQRKMDSSLLQIVVPDTVLALGKLAQEWRNQFKLPVVGLTGSNGKTTLKNMVAAILRAACDSPDEVLATEGNLNNHLGVPLMLARLNSTHRYAVIEMGMNHFGEIAYLTELVAPSVAIITNAAPAHLQGVADLAGVAKAKGEIFLGLSRMGTAILNADDVHFTYWKKLIGKQACLSFGLQSPADVYATIHARTDAFKQPLTITTPFDRFEVLLPLLGAHNVMNALAATAACIALRVSPEAVKKGLESIEPARGRLQMHTFQRQIRVIDDTYNANPASMTAAIKVLASFIGNKILILGDMRELGDDASNLHANLGKIIQQAGINYLFTYGELSEQMGCNFAGTHCHFHDQQQLVVALRKYIQPNTTLLIKGSRSMKMENVVAGLKESLTETFA